RAYALALFVAISLFIAFYIRRGIIKPLNAVFETTEAIAGGDFKRRLNIRTGDEIETLADSINNMALVIEGAITNLEGLVQQRTEEMVAANEEMIASNEELQASYGQLEVTTHELEDLNQRFAEANEELKGLERLKTDFLHTISHELRSPLSPILGYLEIMKDGGVGELTSKQKEVVAEMHICGKNMQLLIDELLEVASIQSGAIMLELKEVDLYPILLHAVKEVREYAEEVSTEIELSVPEDPLLLVGDRKSLLGIFTHLLRNAVKFSQEKGKVEVEVKVKVNGVEVTVSDKGIGIPKDRLDKIFDVFYQVDSSRARRYEGVGLGLYLVKKLTDLHHGSIRVESKEGEGTSFSVFIPKGLNSGTGVETQSIASLPKTGKMPVPPSAEVKYA
ncbi:MAG: ATP-binding protein, partial [Deltaproteobacteria bacterium]